MKKFKTIMKIVLLVVLFVGLYSLTYGTFRTTGTTMCAESQDKVLWRIVKSQIPIASAKEADDGWETKLTVKYTSLGVPNVNSSFKTWMNYKAVTDKKSHQYKFIHTWGWVDSEGFMRCSGDKGYGIDQDYYLIALGSYYGTTIGTKYKITLDTGKVFYGALADCKADRHTNSTNQYIPKNGNVVEFLVDASKLNKDVKRMGSANVYKPLNGKVAKIERMDFIVK